MSNCHSACICHNKIMTFSAASLYLAVLVCSLLAGVTRADLKGITPAEHDCLCLDGDQVIITDRPGLEAAETRGVSKKDQAECFLYKGEQVKDNDQYWYKINFLGQANNWVNGKHLSTPRNIKEYEICYNLWFHNL